MSLDIMSHIHYRLLILFFFAFGFEIFEPFLFSRFYIYQGIPMRAGGYSELHFRTELQVQQMRTQFNQITTYLIESDKRA